jgi:hypothetical protein
LEKKTKRKENEKKLKEEAKSSAGLAHKVMKTILIIVSFNSYVSSLVVGI